MYTIELKESDSYTIPYKAIYPNYNNTLLSTLTNSTTEIVPCDISIITKHLSYYAEVIFLVTNGNIKLIFLNSLMVTIH